MAGRNLLLVGTRKGLFLLDGDATRRQWQIRGPLCDGWPIHDAIVDPASGAVFAASGCEDRATRGIHDGVVDPASGAVFAAGGSTWYGPAVWRSDDLGETWSHSSEGLTYGDDGPKVTTVWNVTTGIDALYAGVEEAGLFRSTDGGVTWEHVEGLTDHPSRPQWQPGAGGLCLHSIVPHPTDPRRLWVGISAVGAFETRDGGLTWETRNKGVRAEFMPERYPEFGQCVHKIVMGANGGERLYQQNHCGVYRSLDGGQDWHEITAGLPSEFGFPMAAHPRDPLTVWTIPLNGADRGRTMPEGHAAVWRTNDGGDHWIQSVEGLPQEHAHLTVLREAMATDRREPVGVYFGTSTGQLYGSVDEGRTWQLVADNLPGIWSVKAATIE